MSLAAALAVWVGLAAAAVVIGGVAVGVAHAATPDDVARALVEEVQAEAPEVLRGPVRVAGVEGGGASGAGADPMERDGTADPHAIVTVQGHRLLVRVPAERSPAWEDAARRAVRHALVHVADRREGWSGTERWRGISAWGRLGGGPGERDPDAFASLAARTSPAEDLAATVTALDDAVRAPPPDPDADPRCRLATKARFVGEVVGPGPPRDCASLADVGLDPDRIVAIELAHATGSLARPASIAGHVLVVLRYAPDAAGLERREAWSLVASTTGEHPTRETLAGLVGGLPSILVHEPFERVLQGYARGDDRDVRRYTLRLTPDQEAALLARLDELRQGWDRPYLFFSRNCTALPEALLAPFDLSLPTPLSPDALLGELARRGLVDDVAPERVEEVAVSARALAADRLRVAAAREIGGSTPELRAPLRDALARGPRRADRRARGYATVGEAVSAGGVASPDTLVALDRLLGWSDVVEQAAALDSPSGPPSGEPASPDDPSAIAALRAAKAAVRARALASGVPLTALGDTDAALLAALTVPRAAMGAHSPLRPLTLRVGAAPDEAWAGLEGALYHSAVGEPRRFSTGATTSYTVARAAWALTTDGDLLVDGDLFALHHLSPSRGPAATGWYLRLGQVDSRWGTTRTSEARWLDAGGLLGLWRGREGGALGWVSAGVAVDARFGESPSPTSLSPTSLSPFGLLTPVGLHARLGSRREALTALTLTAEAAPRLTVDGLSASLSGAVEAGLRLGSVGGADVGLLLSGGLAGELSGVSLAGDASSGFGPATGLPAVPAVSLGLRLERH